MIDAQSLSMHFGQVTALHDATFHVGQGEILGLLGPNGAGKSTIMKILTTYLRPSQGTAMVCGLDILKNPRKVREKIGYLPEHLPLYLNMEVGEYLTFVAQARGLSQSKVRERLDWVLTKTDLLPMFYRPIAQLSKGYRQRTALAQALIHDPEVIILDEPTTGLDPHQVLEIRNLIQELSQSKTILFSTHILHEVEAIAHRVVIISQGTIKAQGTVAELAMQANVRPWITMEIQKSSAEVLQALQQLSGVDQAYVIVEDGPWATIRIAALAPVSTLEQIFALCQAQNWPLRKLNLENPSLEKIFLALTRLDQAV